MWRRRRKLISEDDWVAALDVLPMLDTLDGGERVQLRELSSRFIASKSIEPVRGQRLETADLVVIAAQACLPVLALGLDAYAPWRSVVVYPGSFVAHEHEVDESGVEHEWDEARAGEAWFRGPVILSWRIFWRQDGARVITSLSMRWLTSLTCWMVRQTVVRHCTGIWTPTPGAATSTPPSRT